VRARGVGGRLVYLLEGKGAAADLVARDGDDAVTYAEQVEGSGLARLAEELDGISPAKKLLIDPTGAAHPELVDRAHAEGLVVFTWTLRPENKFLVKANRSSKVKADRGDWRTEFATIIGTGVDGVFADHPELAREVLQSAAEHAVVDVGGRA
jgi:glycerophosphoryl diester phosphodiesterase